MEDQIGWFAVSLLIYEAIQLILIYLQVVKLRVVYVKRGNIKFLIHTLTYDERMRVP